MKSVNFVKLNSVTGLPLTLTFEGSGVGTGRMYADGTIVVETTTTSEANKTITLTTPVAFRVLDVYSIHNDTVRAQWTIKNTGSAITSLIDMAGAGDKAIDRAISVATGNYEFKEDDDDLVIAIDSTGAALAIWVFNIQFIE